MKRVEMLSVYFSHDSGNTQSWILKGHAEKAFWEFMTTWSTAIRKPSDIGFEDNNFMLTELNQIQHTVGSRVQDGRLFVIEAKTLDDQRKERKLTINARCDKVAEIANSNNDSFICWCSFNDESKMLASKINGAVEITGSDKDEEKEKKMLGFSDGSIRCVVTKPSIAGFGMNWQHCSQMSFFPSHSHEQYYQAIRRCWRFGQKKDVDVHIVTSEAESTVLENMKRKERQSNNMFDKIIKHMGQSEKRKQNIFNKEMEIPEWLNAEI
jgi:superfamily II DNA or RNA helicase